MEKITPNPTRQHKQATQEKEKSQDHQQASQMPPAMQLATGGDLPGDSSSGEAGGGAGTSQFRIEDSSAPTPPSDNQGPAFQLKSDGGSLIQKMGNSMGQDFSDVNFHPNSNAATDAGALAFAQGNDVHFAPGQFKPDTSSGQHLIGHELAHVAQQRAGRVQPTTEVGGMPVNDDPGLESEADQMASKAIQAKFDPSLSDFNPGPQKSSFGGTSQRKVMQRWQSRGTVSGVIHVHDTSRDENARRDEPTHHNEHYRRQLNAPVKAGTVAEWQRILDDGDSNAFNNYLFGFLMMAENPGLVGSSAPRIAAYLNQFFRRYSAEIKSESATNYATADGLSGILGTALADSIVDYDQNIIENFANSVSAAPTNEEQITFLEALYTMNSGNADLPFSSLWERVSVVHESTLFGQVKGDIVQRGVRSLILRHQGEVLARIANNPDQRVVEQGAITGLANEMNSTGRMAMITNAGATAFKGFDLLATALRNQNGAQESAAFQTISNAGHTIRGTLATERSIVAARQAVMVTAFNTMWSTIPGGGVLGSAAKALLKPLFLDGLTGLAAGPNLPAQTEAFRVRFERAATNLGSNGHLPPEKARMAVNSLFSSSATY